MHLPELTTARVPTVLDAGCGQGTQALRLARAGYDVTGIDPSGELLAEAIAAAADEPPSPGAVRFVSGDLLALGDAGRACFDVVCCHGVLMYLESLSLGIDALVRAARPGGLISVLTRNRAGLALRAGMERDWPGALAAFPAHRYTNRLGLSDVRADDPDEVDRALRDAGAEPVAWYGVRLFTDHWGAEDVPADFELLVAAEEQAGRRDPYRRLAALTHTLARRPLPPSAPWFGTPDSTRKGRPDQDIRDSTPDRSPSLADKAPEGAPTSSSSSPTSTGLAAWCRSAGGSRCRRWTGSPAVG